MLVLPVCDGCCVIAATKTMSPVQNRATGLPIPVQAQVLPQEVRKATATLASGYVSQFHDKILFHVLIAPGVFLERRIRSCHMIWRRIFNSFQSRSMPDNISRRIGLGSFSSGLFLLLR